VRVLLVEDDAALASVVVEALEQDGHSTTHVWEPQEARRLAVAESWDAFVVDAFGGHQQPDPEYRATLEHLASRGRVIVTSGRAWAAHTAPRDLGADAVFVKPYDLGDLSDALAAGEDRPR
jgi:DNA-binding response OmpR family regulator